MCSAEQKPGGSTWLVLTRRKGEAYELFGAYVAVDGNTIVVSAPRA